MNKINPIINHQSQITNHQPQITNHKSQIANHKSLITNHNPQTINHKPKIINHKCWSNGCCIGGWWVPVVPVSKVHSMSLDPRSTPTKTEKRRKEHASCQGNGYEGPLVSTRRFWPTCLDSILPVDESEYCTCMTWIDALLM